MARARLLQARLDFGDIDAVVVGRVQSGRRRRRHPGGVGAGLRVGDLLFEHRRHQIGHRPHALADLGVTGQATFKPDVDVPVFIGADPGCLLHVTLADHRAGFHRGVHLVASAIEEAGVDEDDALAGRADAFLEVDRRAALLVHDAHLHGVGGHAERLFDTGENFAGEGDFLGAMHLRLDDIHGTLAGIHAATAVADIVEGNQRRHHRVHDALGHFLAVAVKDSRIRHEVADVADQHQRAAGKESVPPAVAV